MKRNQPIAVLFVGTLIVLGALIVALVAAQNGEEALYTPVISTGQGATQSDRTQTTVDLHTQAMILAEPVVLNETGYRNPDVQQAEVLRQAIELLTQAIEQQPDFASAYINRGNLYDYLGEVELALADYDLAISFGTAAVAYQNKRNLLESLGQLEAALEHYELALRSFGISTETFVDAASNIDAFLFTAKKRVSTDLLYTPGVVSTIEKVLSLRMQLERPLDMPLQSAETKISQE
jgi:tetratricopeptide (TPR) repeat protein